VSAQNLAKAHRAAGERAQLAAKWALDRLLITKPTEALAARIFGISPALVSAAVDKLKVSAADPSDMLAFWWDQATPKQQDAFIRANLVSAWDSIDRCTLNTVAPAANGRRFSFDIIMGGIEMKFLACVVFSGDLAGSNSVTASKALTLAGYRVGRFSGEYRHRLALVGDDFLAVVLDLDDVLADPCNDLITDKILALIDRDVGAIVGPYEGWSEKYGLVEEFREVG
jgi:hypothetical protein